MTDLILTLNAGSSSLKVGLFQACDPPVPLVRGQIDRIGGDAWATFSDAAGAALIEVALPAADGRSHAGAVRFVLAALDRHFPGRTIQAVGHRVVHGGPDFAAPVVVTPEIRAALAAFVPFAPLHQPHNLAGIDAAIQAFPEALQVACFDTAFHRNHPWVNDVFALPRQYYDEGVRRYGFHGLSYDYVSGTLQRTAPDLHTGRVVIAHLGNGASMCGLLAGRSIGSTMGFSALDGLPMGTRCGQIDPGVLLYLMDQKRMSAAEISDLLYKRSGLLGLSGLSNDMRTLETAGTPEAEDAIAYFVFRIRRELGALAAVLCGLDALVFCGGIGEHSAQVRARVCAGQAWLGIELDQARNDADAPVVSSDQSRVRVLVIPTDEEQVIARAASDLLGG